MAEQTDNLSTVTQEQPKISGAGRRQAFSFASASNEDNVSEIQEAISINNEEQSATEPKVETKVEPQPTNEQFKAYLKSLNIDFDGDAEALKQKLKPSVTEPTAEQKAAAALAEEKAILDLYLENGGTIDQFGAIKNIANSPLEELSRSAVIKELVDAGFTKEEAEDEMNYRYHLNALDSLEKDEDETDEQFADRKAKIQKKVDFGAKRLASHSFHIKQQAEQFFTGLKEAIKAKEAQKQQEVSYSSKVDEHFTKMPREITLDLGERNGQKLDPIQFRVPDAVFEQTREVLRDSAQRKQFFFNPDGTLNIDNVSKLLVGYNALQHASKLSFIEGQHRNTQEFESIFPARTAYQAGLSGAQPKASQKGVPVSRGPVEKVRRQPFQNR